MGRTNDTRRTGIRESGFRSRGSNSVEAIFLTNQIKLQWNMVNSVFRSVKIGSGHAKSTQGAGSGTIDITRVIEDPVTI
jgi:hypothetical protein